LPPPQNPSETLHTKARARAERCARVVDALKNLPQFSEQLLELAASDALKQRTSWAARRKANDDWFFETFRIPA